MRIALLLAVLTVLAVPALASGSTISPYQPPTTTGGACAPEPILPGARADFGALVVLFQPGPTDGSTCGLYTGGTVVGNQIIVGLYTPNPVPNDTVPVGVEEFHWQTITVRLTGPNNTTVTENRQVPAGVVFSNVSVSALPGVAQEFVLSVPPVPSQENLTIAILGLTESYAIVVPGAGVAIPVNYPQLLLHDLAFQIYVVLFFAVGVGVATVIRLRARHVERLWPFGMVGILGTFGFLGWFYGSYPASAVPLGSAPEALISVPVVLGGIYLWLLLFPTEAKLAKIRFPVADVRDGDPLYDTRTFRLYQGPDGPEYIGPKGAGALLRFFGVRTKFDDRVLTPAPHRVSFAGFRSVKHDPAFEYFAWAEFSGGPKVLEVVSPKVWLFPWRARTQEAIREHYRTALRDRAKPPTHFGFFFHISESRAFASVVGKQGASLVIAWISGTLHASKVGVALEELHVRYTELKVSLKARALDLGLKHALAIRLAEEFPDSPLALAALEDLATTKEAEMADQTGWLGELQAKVDERSQGRGRRVVPIDVEAVLREVRETAPPEWRGKGSRPLRRPS